MSIQQAVQQADQEQEQQRQAAVEKISPGKIVEQQLDIQEAQFALLLPRNFDSKKFKRQTLSAIKASPDLMECFATPSGRTSIFLAAMNAASLGLEPNTPKQECWLIPRRIKGVLECQFSIGYRGYVKLIWGSGGVETIYFDVVRSEDDYEFSRTLKADTFRHTPTGRGELVEAYAGVRYLDGAYSFIRLTKEQVYERRAKSDAWKADQKYGKANSPWSTSEEAMWKKSALRALVPSLRLSEQAASDLALDESSFQSSDGKTVIDIPEWQTTVTDEAQLNREELELPKNADINASVLDVDSATGEIVEKSGSSFDLLTAVMQEHQIEGAARLNKVAEVTGNKPKRWLPSDISEEDARAVIDHLDGQLH